MYDQAAVRMMNGTCNLRERLQPVIDAQSFFIAEPIDASAFDVLHDEIRPAVGRSAAVQQFCNAGMVERGEDLTFGFEPMVRLEQIRPSADDPDGNAHTELPVMTFAHAERHS